MFITTLSSDPRYFFAVVITVVVSITLHELAHGLAAIRRGDDTPILLQRMTLNPLVHMGGFSIVALLLMGIAWGQMPVNPTRLRGRYAEAFVAAAGPATNLALALAALLALGLWQRAAPLAGAESQPIANAQYLLQIFGVTNLLLMMFNLLPVPPLDGSHILANVVPQYRRLLSGPAVGGVMTAVLLAMLLGGGRYLASAAWHAAEQVLVIARGS